jgi:glycosyltransferase involved in cell wall biosynthesis
MLNTYVVPVSIPSYFKPSDKPKIPVVSILTRNQGDAVKIAKSFYLQYPIYKWITFKELRGEPRETLAEELKKSCLAVWVDDAAGFGTFPIEAMECGTPVIGKIPNMVPEWMETIDENGNPVIKNNGVWTNTTINIPELIATYLKVWFEDAIPNELIETMKSSTGQYTLENQKEVVSKVYSQLVEERKGEFNQIIINANVTYAETK